jgi:hypothetical protein
MKKLILVILITVCICATAIAGSLPRSGVTKPSRVYLVVMSSTNTGNNVFNYVYHEMYDWQQCFDVIKNSRVDIPTSGDAESSIAMYCAPNKGRYLDYKQMSE